MDILEAVHARHSVRKYLDTPISGVEKEILEKLRGQLDSNYYNYDTIFFNGNDKLPRWSSYSLGYYLVKKYLEKTNKKIEDAFADKYAEFKIAL